MRRYFFVLGFLTLKTLDYLRMLRTSPRKRKEQEYVDERQPKEVSLPFSVILSASIFKLCRDFDL